MDNVDVRILQTPAVQRLVKDGVKLELVRYDSDSDLEDVQIQDEPKLPLV